MYFVLLKITQVESNSAPRQPKRLTNVSPLNTWMKKGKKDVFNLMMISMDIGWDSMISITLHENKE